MAKGVALSHLSTAMEVEQATVLLPKALAIFKQIDDVRGVSACLLRMAGMNYFSIFVLWCGVVFVVF